MAQCKGIVFPLHAIKAYGERRFSSIQFNLSSRWRWVF